MPSRGSRTATVALIIIATARLASAGEWHYGAHIVCSDCHTQHNSENGQPMRYDRNVTAAPYLLRFDTAVNLCLSCHDGSKPNAPGVMDPVSYVADPAGGSFPPMIQSPSTAHHLNSPTAEVAPGGTVPMVLTCTTCHDPHGNANYRNLRPDPLNVATTTPLILTSQTNTANGTNPAQVYASNNIIYKSGVSAWCGKCHGTFSGNDHPTDRPMFGATFANYANWVSTTLPRVPVNSPTDNAIPSQDDQVMCLSCHKAHGSANVNALIYADGSTIDSTCQECHDQ